MSPTATDLTVNLSAGPDLRPQGVDVSHYQGNVSTIIASQQFAISQASVGTWTDSMNAEHLREMARFPALVRETYHYAVYGPGPTRQAMLYLRNSEPAEILNVDAETRGTAGLLFHPDTITALIVNIRRLDQGKRPVNLYSSRATSVRNPKTGQPVSIWSYITAQDHNWVADYDGDPNRPTTSPRVPWTFWQKSGTGIDRDVFNGSVAQLYTLAGR